MKGKGITIGTHIVNAIGILILGFVSLEMSANLFHDKPIDTPELGTSIACLIGCLAVFAAEIVLIVYQVKHKYGKAVFISGLVGSILFIAAVITTCTLLIIDGVSKKTMLMVFGIVGLVALIAIADLLLYVFIRKKNLAVETPSKVVSAPEKTVTEKKSAPVAKKPTVKKKVTAKKKAKKVKKL